jgi:hypothetical protein
MDIKNIHLNEESLQLTSRRVWLTEICTRHKCAYIGHHITKRGIKHKSVDRLVERARSTECDHDEETSQQRNHRTHSFDVADKIQLMLSETVGHVE